MQRQLVRPTAIILAGSPTAARTRAEESAENRAAVDASPVPAHSGGNSRKTALAGTGYEADACWKIRGVRPGSRRSVSSARRLRSAKWNHQLFSAKGEKSPFVPCGRF